MGNLNNKKKVRVLEIAHGLVPGGIESFLINNYIKNNDFKKEIIEDRINSFNIKNVVKDIERIYLQA